MLSNVRMLRASDGIRVKLQKEEKEYHAMSIITKGHAIITCSPIATSTGVNKEND